MGKGIVSRILTVGAVAVLCTATALPAQTQAPTAGAAQQSNQSSDLSITRNIRRTLMKDKSLSTEARNVTIITKDGKVTLKGQVKSAGEKQSVESAASGAAGAGNVDDQISISQ